MLLDHQPTTADITPPPAPRPEAVQLRARRSPRLIAAGILSVVLGALGGAALYSITSDQADVVVMERDVVRGQTLQAADLAVVSMPSSSQVDMTRVSDMDALVGETALSDLPSGSFPVSHHVGEQTIPQDHSLVGIRLPEGRLPTAELKPGARVQLVSLVEGDDLVMEATVASAPMLAVDGAGQLLDVIVTSESAPGVAALAATDQLVLIAVGES